MSVTISSGPWEFVRLRTERVRDNLFNFPFRSRSTKRRTIILYYIIELLRIRDRTRRPRKTSFWSTGPPRLFTFCKNPSLYGRSLSSGGFQKYINRTRRVQNKLYRLVSPRVLYARVTTAINFNCFSTKTRNPQWHRSRAIIIHKWPMSMSIIERFSLEVQPGRNSTFGDMLLLELTHIVRCDYYTPPL